MDGTRELASVRIEGLDIGKGLELYEGDEQVYLEILHAFFAQGQRQLDVMRGALDGGDLPRYGIEAHALKSASRGLGAIDLSVMAAAQETAGKKGDEDAVRSGAGALLTAYRALLDAIEVSGLARVQTAPADDTPVEPDALREQLAYALEHAGSYDLPSVEETLRELLRHPLEPRLDEELRSVLELCGQFMYDEVETTLQALQLP